MTPSEKQNEEYYIFHPEDDPEYKKYISIDSSTKNIDDMTTVTFSENEIDYSIMEIWDKLDDLEEKITELNRLFSVCKNLLWILFAMMIIRYFGIL
jgi:hypothetical protein